MDWMWWKMFSKKKLSYFFCQRNVSVYLFNNIYQWPLHDKQSLCMYASATINYVDDKKNKVGNFAFLFGLRLSNNSIIDSMKFSTSSLFVYLLYVNIIFVSIFKWFVYLNTVFMVTGWYGWVCSMCLADGHALGPLVNTWSWVG